ncbi:sensor histidine kinase [Cohnella nanjingensis]|uniref:sensor histidine kinase n=1 Tax=Cohnella nanjingensis TaxID=1387779 RepID=UPI001FEA9429|nr:sensor histidine kinase [Cohnella nanjingensis]
MTIRQRLLALIVFFICFPLLLIGWSWYRSSTETIEQSAIQANTRLIQQTNDYLDLYLTNLANSTYPFSNNSLVQKLLSSPALKPYDYFQLSEKVEEDLFSQMIYGRSDIVGISLVTSSGRQIHDFSSSDEPLDMRDIRIRNAGFMSRIGELVDFQVLKSGTVGTTPVVTVTRKLYNNLTYKYEGLLIVDLNLKQIEHICRNASLGSFNVWIADVDGRILYHSDPALMGTRLKPEFRDRLDKARGGFFRLEQPGGEQLVLYAPSRSTDWTIVADTSLHEVIGGLIRMRNLTLIAASVLLIVVLAAVSGFSFSFTRPLSRLQQLMAKVETGDFVVRRPGGRQRHDEIGSVFDSFYRMVGELNRLGLEVHSAKLKERELTIKHKESALQAMQSHINPHFLYNSLEIINSEAIVSGNREISRMTSSLAHMFRYNADHTRQDVLLRDELAHIRSYLDIQQARFPKLQVAIDIPEPDAARVRALRLTLQPLVENAFLHGYKNKKPTFIGIEGQAEPEAYCVSIADRGFGMPAERLAALARLLDAEEPSAGADRTGGIGLLNVHGRLRMLFGAPFGLSIRSSSADGGTVFVLRLPYVRLDTTQEEADPDVQIDDRRG